MSAADIFVTLVKMMIRKAQLRAQKMNTCSFTDRQIQRKIDARAFGCIFVQKEAREVNCPEIYEPAAVWRFMLKYLP